MTDLTREQIVTAARSYVGVRFAKSGRDRNRGVDCVGLLTLVGRDLGLDIQDMVDYNFEPKPDTFLNMIRSQTDSVPTNGLKAGNIVLLRQSIYPMHCGIIGRTSTGMTVINANLHARSVVEQPIADWRDEIIELRDYRGIIG
jgi:cell wall-associated NlpC family hydrolase